MRDAGLPFLVCFPCSFGADVVCCLYWCFWTQTVSEMLQILQKEGEAVVELDQFKSILANYTEPLVEVRDSL